MTKHEQRMDCVRQHACRIDMHYDPRLPENSTVVEKDMTLEYFEYMIDQEEKAL